MEVMTSDGIRIYCLPGNACCKIERISPIELDYCPECKFDYYGNVCIPEICEDYTEGDYGGRRAAFT